MATFAQLEQAIDTFLNHPFGAANFQLANMVEEKAYEAYIFGLCLEAVRILGATPTLRGIAGAPNPFVFRGAPGKIHSTYRNYGYAEFTVKGEEFEIHAGVEFRGTSNMVHELDVSIMRAAEAGKCRQQPADPDAASLVGGWECKFYDRQLDKVLGRAFVGLLDDMGTRIRLEGLCSNRSHPELKEYFQPARRPYGYLEVSPLYGDNERLFVNSIALELKKMTAL